jgi:hypothetical protein
MRSLVASDRIFGGISLLSYRYLSRGRTNAE